MVSMVVGGHDQIDGPDAVAAQGGVEDHRVRPTVDENDRVRRMADEDGVALTDVEEHHRGLGRRSAPANPRRRARRRDRRRAADEAGRRRPRRDRRRRRRSHRCHRAGASRLPSTPPGALPEPPPNRGPTAARDRSRPRHRRAPSPVRPAGRRAGWPGGAAAGPCRSGRGRWGARRPEPRSSPSGQTTASGAVVVGRTAWRSAPRRSRPPTSGTRFHREVGREAARARHGDPKRPPRIDRQPDEATARAPPPPSTTRRMTDASHRVATTNTPRAAMPRAARTRGSTRKGPITSHHAARKTATLLPDTATKWVRPACRSSSRRTGAQLVGVADEETGQKGGGIRLLAQRAGRARGAEDGSPGRRTGPRRRTGSRPHRRRPRRDTGRRGGSPEHRRRGRRCGRDRRRPPVPEPTRHRRGRRTPPAW